MSNSHRDAHTLLKQVFIYGHSLTEALAVGEHDPLTRAMCFGVCRYYFQLEAIAQLYLSKPFKEKDRDVNIAILMGLYQLDHMNMPAHAVINETVKLAKAVKKPWASSVINAVLRSHQRRTTPLDFSDNDEARTAHPQWLIDRITSQWPEQAEFILQANNEKAPMSLRVNAQRITTGAYSEKLTQCAMPHRLYPGAQQAIILDEPCAVTQLPGFDAGEISVQDISAQWAASLLQAQSGQRVLDACAAPGGKTCHLLEMTPDLIVHAMDVSESRLVRLRENAQRLRVSPALHAMDALRAGELFEPGFFDRILLDAPCSATGVIRRHPDIKWLRQDSDIAALASTQLALLEAMWPLLKCEGLLLYATCSLLRDENDAVIATFMASYPDAVLEPITLDAGIATPYGWQLFPTVGLMDGFYYARLRKRD